MTHAYSECSSGATGSCSKASLTLWNVFDPKARKLNIWLPPSQGLGMPYCPRGSCTSQVQVQGWAAGGERAQWPRDAPGPQHLRMSYSRKWCSSGRHKETMGVFQTYLVKDSPLDLSIPTFHAHKMEILNLTCFSASTWGENELQDESRYERMRGLEAIKPDAELNSLSLCFHMASKYGGHFTS